MGPRDPLLEAMAEVKVNANQLRKQATKAESMSRAQEDKATKAMKKGQFQISRIHAGSAIREKRRSVTLLSKAAEADVIYSDLAAAKSTRDSTRSLMKASKALDSASRSINLERTLAIANAFVSRSEDFKLAGSALEGVSRDVQMAEYGAEGAEDEVDKLMERLADNAGVDLRQNLEENAAPSDEIGVKAGKQKEPDFEDGLAGRLRALRS
ncbi:SNF7 family protein Fti1/Did2 [Coccidioides immitis RS]|uniref:SNF7 family protein Fti1/Did2 n=5 Tax=Coccidioides TaxID=5500 RepID=J3K5J1_COCIM|nr:SNF7 family protein Fti1/Did2 [Coccidioides immitis RS]EAS29710.3 SNF7 family protein Fti1/Did2 [Coccidioides immitis RS]EFW15071.1 SNF7 family protein Fti1/Did2 [Coccidioides posadasii str. Silveira]KMM68841.1 vacuolar protein-sorting-associated protein 46 [Coccidioides posadasii RMSCC 3488]QVM09909.1 Vacuolar-sorting protein SNF7 [Coccidioides posadasii str. Silveira]